VDDSDTHSPYIERYSLFADPERAIEKLRTICQAELGTKALYGECVNLTELTPDMLKPGIRFVFAKNYPMGQLLRAYILAISETK